MSTTNETSYTVPTASEMDQFFDFIATMSENDPLFKNALTRVLKGEEHETVVSELLCDGNMNDFIEANLQSENGSEVLIDAINDAKIINEANNLINRIKELEIESETLDTQVTKSNELETSKVSDSEDKLIKE
jgi:hypothetical protein